MGRILRTLSWGLLFLVVLTLLLLGFVRVRIMPELLQLAQARASAESSSRIVESISRQMSSGNLRYDRIICFEKDYEGKITALKTNMQQANLLKNQVLSDLNGEITGVTSQELGIPAGNLLLPALFAGRGPRIPVRILAVRSSEAEFISHFTQAGINQTLHRLSMQVKVQGIALVLGRIQTFSASGTVLVAETVIVGQVPHTFS